MLGLRPIVAVIALQALLGCAASTAPEATTSTAGTAERVALASGDAPALAGTWTGDYVSDSGFRGRTTLTLRPAGPAAVNGVFEYRWRGGNYDRFPATGTTGGGITGDGTLAFGSWQLALYRDGEQLEFRTRQQIGGTPSDLRWRKVTSPLPSETQ